MESDSRLICGVCQKGFSSVSTKNRHLKMIHNNKVDEKKSLHIRCPLCPAEEREALGNYANLINHLTQVHNVSIKQSNLNFENIEEFDAWRAKDNREINYACYRRRTRPNGDQYVVYNCNRSNSYGFHSSCTKRAMKIGGSIRISGVCPSRISVKIFKNGVSVKFIETHVGHQDILRIRTKRLLKRERAVIVEQLYAEEKIKNEANKSIKFEKRQQIALEEVTDYAKNLDEESFEKLMGMFSTFKNNLEREKTNKIRKKRKIDKQTYYPNKN